MGALLEPANARLNSAQAATWSWAVWPACISAAVKERTDPLAHCRGAKIMSGRHTRPFRFWWYVWEGPWWLEAKVPGHQSRKHWAKALSWAPAVSSASGSRLPIPAAGIEPMAAFISPASTSKSALQKCWTKRRVVLHHSEMALRSTARWGPWSATRSKLRGGKAIPSR